MGVSEVSGKLEYPKVAGRTVRNMFYGFFAAFAKRVPGITYPLQRIFRTRRFGQERGAMYGGS